MLIRNVALQTTIAIALATASLPLSAQDLHWEGGSGDFDATTNWTTCPPGDCDPAAAPGEYDNVVFDIAAGTSNLSGDSSVHNLDVWGTETTLDLGGNELTVTRPDFSKPYSDVTVGASSSYNSNTSSTLNIENGDLTVSSNWDFDIGVENGYSGHVNVRNSGNLNTAEIFVGGSDQTSTLTVSGSGSSASGGTRISNGLLTVENGGQYNGGGFISGNSFGAGTATITGSGSSWTASGMNVSGFSTSMPGVLNVLNGGTVTSNTAGLGNYGNSSGQVTVSGAGSAWTILREGGTVDAGILNVGDIGDGTLNVLDGASVENEYFAYVGGGNHGNGADATGSALVSGTGSTWTSKWRLWDGLTGNGSLTVADGGTVTTDVPNGSANQGIFIGNTGSSVSGTGTAVVTGSGSTLASGGGIGVLAGTLDVENGGSVTSTTAGTISNGSTVTVTGAGSSWESDTGMEVGRSGSGTLNILDGGRVTNTTGYVSFLGGSNGTATVSGNGSVWNNTNMNVGLFATGELNIENGGTVNVSNNLNTGSGGTINLSGGTLEAGTIDAGSSIFNMTGGTLKADSFIGDLVNAGGTVGPGHSPGILTVSGNYSQDSTSALLIEIDGIIAGSGYDLLDVSGDADLAGVLDIDLDDGLSLNVGDTFNILLAASVSGEFDTILGRRIDESLRFEVFYGADAVSLTVAAVPLPAGAWLFLSALGAAGLARRKRS